MSTYPPINPSFPLGGQQHLDNSFRIEDSLNASLFNEYERVQSEIVQKLEAGTDPGHQHTEISSGYWGQEVFSSAAGKRINHGKNLQYYTVQITPVTIPLNAIGDIWVEIKNANEFTVYNTGANNTGTFRWVLKQLEKVETDISGNSRFNSLPGVAVEHNYPFTDHILYVIPTQNPQGYLGEYWVMRSSIIDIVYNSGTSTANFQYRLEILDDVEQWAVMNFAGPGGVVIPHSLTTANFDVFVIPEQNPLGYLGEVWVNKTTSNFTVFNSGTANTRFVYFISGLSSPSYLMRGRANFSSVSGTVIQHNLNTLNYDFLLMPIENPNGLLGEVYVDKGRNIATVYNLGSSNVLFDYRIEAGG